MTNKTLANYARFQTIEAEERRAIFDIVSGERGIVGTNVEKDFWVCYTLCALMRAKPTVPKRFFKGGTSLSKGYGLIERFSEDVDIVLARPGLFKIDQALRGKPDPFDPATKFESKKKQRSAQDEVFKAAQRFVYGPLKVSLLGNLPDLRIEDDRSRDAQPTLLVWYPSVYPEGLGEEPAYNQRRVKLETGPRGATEPTSNRLIRPYIHSALKGKGYDFTVKSVAMISAERTFLEKVSAIHGMNRRFEVEGKEPRQEQPPTRHLYDVASIMKGDVGKRAVTMKQLMEDVCNDSEKTFPSPYIAEIRIGKLKLIPPDGLRKLLEADYEKMKGMMYGEASRLDYIYAQLADAESAISKTMLGQ
jgi:nucleotidyltransferase AbiEii toxin of type IV toxin-antitoxin system